MSGVRTRKQKTEAVQRSGEDRMANGHAGMDGALKQGAGNEPQENIFLFIPNLIGKFIQGSVK